jgi:protein-tyrosine phosphatase
VTPRTAIDTAGAARPGDVLESRHVPFQVVFNVRDLGGLPTRDGQTVRRRRLYRGDGVHRLDGDDLASARSLGLRTVLDLRTEGELERGRFPTDRYPVDWHHLPLLRRIWSDDDLTAGTSAAEFLAARYLDMVEESGDVLARVVGLLADGAPALFHCAAGKDRTGVVAAVVLGLLGVPEEEIAADYHASAAAMGAFQDWIATEFPEAASSMTTQPPEYLEAPVEAMDRFLQGIEDRHGSTDGLARDLGLSPVVVDRLRATMLQP